MVSACTRSFGNASKLIGIYAPCDYKAENNRKNQTMYFCENIQNKLRDVMRFIIAFWFLS